MDEYFEGYGAKKERKYYEYQFGNREFYLDFNTLRAPAKYELGSNNTLRLYGAESPFSNQHQSMFVRRQTDFCFEATTCLTLPFHRFQQFAGLIYRYDEDHQYLLKMSFDEELQKQKLSIMAFRDGEYSAALEGKEICIEGDQVRLRLTGEGAKARFSYSLDGKDYTDIDYVIDASILSDDHCYGFTGAYVGMAAYNLYDHTSYADFTYFSYRVL